MEYFLMRIGIVDLDTSHPENWIPIEHEWGCDIVGVYDGGSIHPRSYVEQFAKRFDIPRIYDDLEQMASDVDGVIIHGCDWDTHIAKAKPFVERGKSVMLDKPLAGNVRDLRQISRWVRDGARITGGSALRFCRETSDYFAQPVAQRGTPHTVICGCAVDDFNYGIHAYSHLCGIMGHGIQSVRHMGCVGMSSGGGEQRRVQVNWDDGRKGILIIGKAAAWQPFYASIITEQTCTQMQVDHTRLYRALLETCLPYLAGKTDQPPVAVEQLIEAELAALAAMKSWTHGDALITLLSLSDADAGYHGPAFADEYRLQKYPAKGN